MPTIAERWVEEGMKKGLILEKQNVLIRLLSKKFSLTEKERESIRQIESPDLLDAAIDETLIANAKAQIVNLLSRCAV